jgi:hypothetical protein
MVRSVSGDLAPDRVLFFSLLNGPPCSASAWRAAWPSLQALSRLELSGSTRTLRSTQMTNGAGPEVDYLDGEGCRLEDLLEVVSAKTELGDWDIRRRSFAE